MRKLLPFALLLSAIFFLAIFLLPQNIFAQYINCANNEYAQGSCNGLGIYNGALCVGYNPQTGETYTYNAENGNDCCTGSNPPNGYLLSRGATSCTDRCTNNAGFFCPLENGASCANQALIGSSCQYSSSTTFSQFCCNYAGPTPTLPPPPTPTPTLFDCSLQGGLLYSCFSGGCPTDWASSSQNPNTTCAPSGQTCCWYNPPGPTATPTPTPTPAQPAGGCDNASQCGTPANSCTIVSCLQPPNGICVYNPASAGTVCDANGSVCDGNGTCFVPTPTPTPILCQVTTSPSVHNLAVGGTGTVTASVTSGQGSAAVSQMRFGSYNTSVAAVNPTSDSTSTYSTEVTAVAPGATAVWGTADLSDGRTCQSSGQTDTDINVSGICPAAYNISGTVNGQPSGKKLTVCRDPNTPGSCINAASSTTTNPANGSYTLSNISSDTYHLIYLDPASLPTNYSVSSTNPVNISSNTCPATVNFTIGTGPTAPPTPPIGPTSAPTPPPIGPTSAPTPKY